MQLKKLFPTFGTALAGFDPRQASDNDIARLKALVYDRKVVALKGLDIDRSNYLTFARRFGTIEQFRLKNYHDLEYPEILVINNLNHGQSVGARKLGNMWHSDSSYLPEPLPLTFLHARRVPVGLGDTLFVDMQQTLAELPSEMLAAVVGREAEHDVRYTYKVKESDVGDAIADILARLERSFPPARHPTIAHHPVTGHRALYISPGYTVRLCGYADDEGRAILGRLFDFALRIANVSAYRWEPDDLLIWDNRSVIHCATPLPDDADRLMHRIGVNDGPFFDPKS